MGGFTTPRNLNLNVTATGAEKLDQTAQSLATVGTSAKAASAVLDNMDSRLMELVRSGKTLSEALKEVGTSLDGLTKAGQGRTKEMDREEAALRRMASLMDTAAKEDRRLTDEAKRNAEARIKATQDEAAGRSKALLSIQSAVQGHKSQDADFSKFAASIRSGITDPLGTAGTAAESLLLRLGPVGTVATAAGLAMGGVAKSTYEFVSSAAASAQELTNFANKLNLSTEQAGKLSAMARIVGSDIHSLAAAERFLSAALEDSSGHGKRYAEAIHSLGISLYDTTGKARDFGPVLIQVLEKLSQIPDVTERVNKANEILGRNGAKQIQTLLQQYGSLETAVRALKVSNDDQNSSLSRTQQELKKLEIAYEETKKKLAAKFEPIVVPVLVQLRQSITGEQDTNQQGRPVNRGFLDGVVGSIFGSAFRGGSTVPPGDSAVAEEDRRRIQSADRGKQLAEEYLRRGRNGKLELEARADELKKQIRDADAKLSSKDLNEEAFRSQDTKKRKDEAELKSVEARIKALTEAPNRLKSATERLLEEYKRSVEALQKVEDNPHGAALTEFDDRIRKLAADGQAKNPKLRGLAVGTLITDFAAVDQKTIKEQAERLKKATEAIQDAAAKELFKDDKHTGLQSAIARSLQLPIGPELPINQDPARFAAQSAFRVRQIGLTALPGTGTDAFIKQNAEQLAAAQRLHDITVDRINRDHEGHQRQIELDKERERFLLEQDELRYARLDKYQELQRKTLEEGRSLTGGLYDSLFGGGGGVSQFIKGVLKDQGRLVFQNATEGLAKNGLDSLSTVIGGQRDGGKLTGVGNLLKGTFLADRSNETDLLKNVKAVDLNRQATERNAAATSKLVEKIEYLLTFPGASAGLSADPAVAKLPANSTVTDLLKLIQNGAVSGLGAPGFGSVLGGQVGNSPIFTALGGGSTVAALLGGGGSAVSSLLSAKAGYGGVKGSLEGILTGVAPNPGGGYQSLSGAERVGAGVALAGTVATGVTAAIAGFSKGGARGALAGTSSVLGTAAALDPEPISKAALAIGSAVSGLVGTLLPDEREKRRKEIATEIQNNTYRPPNAVNLEETTGGKSYGRDFRDRYRQYDESPYIQNGSQTVGFDAFNSSRTLDAPTRQIGYQPAPPQVNVTMHIQAWDAETFSQHAPRLTEEIRRQIVGGHPITNAIRNVADRT